MDHPFLKTFKNRMRIFHNADDANLNYILESSQSALERLTGIDDVDIPEFKRLVIEHARYTFYDQAEFFWDNFKSDIMGLSITEYQLMEDKDGK